MDSDHLHRLEKQRAAENTEAKYFPVLTEFGVAFCKLYSGRNLDENAAWSNFSPRNSPKLGRSSNNWTTESDSLLRGEQFEALDWP